MLNYVHCSQCCAGLTRPKEHHTQNKSHSVVLLINSHSENVSLKVPESREQEGS